MTAREPTRRDAKKADKRTRIQSAAAELFRSLGYDGTTTRAIAERAGIATGTLFLYVRDKDEALALVYGDEVDAALSRPAASRGRGFSRAVAHRLRGLCELYARYPDLALRYLRRIPTLEDAEKSAHDARNARFVAVIREELERAISAGELRAELDVALAERTLFAVARIVIFSWLAAPNPTLAGALRELELTVDLLVDGLGAAKPRPKTRR